VASLAVREARVVGRHAVRRGRAPAHRVARDDLHRPIHVVRGLDDRARRVDRRMAHGAVRRRHVRATGRQPMAGAAGGL